MESHTNAIRDDNNVYSDGTDLVRSNGQGNQRANRLPSWFVVQLTITASLGGCLFGYDMGAIGGTLSQLTNTFDLDDRQKQLSKCCQSLPYYFSTMFANLDYFRNHRLSFDLNFAPKAVSILYVGGAIGACIGGGLCDRFGRKVTIMVTDFIFMFGAILL